MDVLNWEDESVANELEQKRTHKLYRRRQTELEKADWEEREDEYTL